MVVNTVVIGSLKKPSGDQFGVGYSGKDLSGCDFLRDQGYESQVVTFVNQVRIQNDLDPLKIRSELISSALANSKDMARNDFVGHAGSDGSHWTDRIAQIYRDNILDLKVTEIGVGYVYSDQSSFGGYYTINFAR
jgi:uncharacterized protein YkwD